VGMTPTPDELEALKATIGQLEEIRSLIEPVGSFRPVGKGGVYDLGGNVAEWVTGKDGGGIIKGLAAVTAHGTGGEYVRPPLAYIGFRVLEE